MSRITVPAAAADAGMTRLVFNDDFDSLDTIDVSGEGLPGFNWYTDLPFRKNIHLKYNEDYTVENSVFTLKTTTEINSVTSGVFSYSTKGRTGFTWQFGYAEARIRFPVTNIPIEEYLNDPNLKSHVCWPAFWSHPIKDFLKDEDWIHCGENDILEAYFWPENKKVLYTAGVHDHWIRPDETKLISVSQDAIHTEFYLDDNWHTYASLWEEGHIAYYFDGRLMHEERFSEDAFPEPSDKLADHQKWKGANCIFNTEINALILGAWEHWPMEVDWVRVWQKD